MRHDAHVESSGPRDTLPLARRTESGSAVAKLVALVAAVTVAAGIAAYLDVLPGDSGRPATPDAKPGSVRPRQSEPGLSLEETPAAGPVLAGIDVSAPVSTAAIRRLVAPELGSPRLGRRTRFAVAPLGSRRLAWQSAPGRDLVAPASTMKLLTTVAALSVLGPDHRFETTVQQGTTARRIVLVGGGDPLLSDDSPTASEAAAAYPAPATLQQLAARTAERLRRSGLVQVSLGYDDSLFTGPAVNPQWEPSYVPESVVSPISALWVDEGRATAGLAARVADPARVAADRFAALLSKRGVDVEPSVRKVAAPVHAATLAAVESPPLAQIVEHVLEASDNEGAEVLLRQVAVASGRPGSATAGVRVVRGTLSRLGVDLSSRHVEVYDGSGLSRLDRLPIEVLVDVLEIAADPDHPELRTVVTSLPVAGFSGSLAYRFVDDAPAGLGVVRAKTGTLTGVHALAGLAFTRNARVLVFAVVADRVPVPRTLGAIAQLDRVAASLAACVC